MGPPNGLVRDARGLSTVEYAVALGLVAVVGIGGWSALGATSKQKVSCAEKTLTGAGQCREAQSDLPVVTTLATAEDPTKHGAVVNKGGTISRIEDFHPEPTPNASPAGIGARGIGGFLWGAVKVPLYPVLNPKEFAKGSLALAQGAFACYFTSFACAPAGTHVLQGIANGAKNWWHGAKDAWQRGDYFGVGESIGAATASASLAAEGVGAVRNLTRAGAAAEATASTTRTLPLRDRFRNAFASSEPRVVRSTDIEALRSLPPDQVVRVWGLDLSGNEVKVGQLLERYDHFKQRYPHHLESNPVTIETLEVPPQAPGSPPHPSLVFEPTRESQRLDLQQATFSVEGVERSAPLAAPTTSARGAPQIPAPSAAPTPPDVQLPYPMPRPIELTDVNAVRQLPHDQIVQVWGLQLRGVDMNAADVVARYEALQATSPRVVASDPLSVRYLPPGAANDLAGSFPPAHRSSQPGYVPRPARSVIEPPKPIPNASTQGAQK